LSNIDDFKKIEVCNNGCWLIGEIANKLPEKVRPHLDEFMKIMTSILNTEIMLQLQKKNDQMMRHYSKTVAISVGRIGIIDPTISSKYLTQIIKPWCIALRYISGSEEKI
jgi:hypothetical protein